MNIFLSAVSNLGLCQRNLAKSKRSHKKNKGPTSQAYEGEYIWLMNRVMFLFKLSKKMPILLKITSSIHKINNTSFYIFQLMIVRQRDKLEPMFHQFLVEDRGANGTASYVDFLCHIHKEIRTLLS